jgi:hypothetical protein
MRVSIEEDSHSMRCKLCSLRQMVDTVELQASLTLSQVVIAMATRLVEKAK